ncbi:hypothetical protein ACGRHW_40865 [Streptomyces noursei]|uniref:hypothetical protein n=1 Tax=Streptomyces noursei TaxID=1971 RepID=UPI003750A194
MLVAAEQFGGSCEVLGDPSVSADSGKGVGEQQVAVFREGGCGVQCFFVEGLRDGDGASGEEFPDPAVRVRSARDRQGCVLVGVFGPEGAQDEDRSAVAVGEECVEGSRDLFADMGVAEVVLGLVEPHHRTRGDAVEFVERSFGPGRVEGVPQPPSLGREGLDGFPAGSRLAG